MTYYEVLDATPIHDIEIIKKQEQKARNYAYELLVPVERFVATLYK